MAVVEIHVAASPERCFEVLADPRSFGYWVVGSRRIRAADPDWPAQGSAFDHTAGLAPFLTHDSTEVEAVETNRMLCLRAKARPFGTAFVRLDLEPEDGGTRLRIREDPGDRITGKLFTPVADRIVRIRNEKAVQRLKALAEGTVEVPNGTLPPRYSDENQAIAPTGRSTIGMVEPGMPARLSADFGRGFAAGLVGAMAMSGSTMVEMRLTGREPSAVPARALRRLLGIQRLGERGERRLTAVAHLLTGAMVGGMRGMLSSFGLRAPYGAPITLTISMTPDLLATPALGVAAPPWRWSAREMAISVLHHGVFAAATSFALARLER